MEDLNSTSTTLVTAIYSYGVNSLYGGRGRGIYFYNSVLYAISLLNLPIIIFAPQHEINEILSYTNSYLKNCKIIPYELDEFLYAQQFLDHKKEIISGIELNDRNHLLCYNKLFWLNDIAQKNPFNTEKFLWIDCGLFHHGIFPEKFGGVELAIKISPDLYYPKHSNSILNPKLGNKLDSFIQKDEIFACCYPIQGDTLKHEYIIEKIYNNKYHISKHVIGGIFGGFKKDIEIFLKQFNSLLKVCIDEKILLLEEPLFSCIAAVTPNLFNMQTFQQWWFYSPGERTSYLSEEGDSFYKIFKRIYDNE
jgi:hypothetical protein